MPAGPYTTLALGPDTVTPLAPTLVILSTPSLNSADVKSVKTFLTDTVYSLPPAALVPTVTDVLVPATTVLCFFASAIAFAAACLLALMF